MTARSETGLPVRTLVIMTGCNPLYEETTTSLAVLGAHHLTLEGAGHHVPDDPRAMAARREHRGE